MIITIDGNIGAGKTTLLEYLKNSVFVREHLIVLEPVEEWLKPNVDDGPSLFEKYYKDRRRYGFLFQMYALKTRITHMYETFINNPGKIILCERSHFTDCYIFAKMLMNDGYMEKQEYDVYNGWFEMCCTLLTNQVKGTIYLRAQPQTCMQRIFKRMRKGEESISFDYIDKLHILHEKWLMDNPEAQFPVCVIDADVSEEKIDFSAISSFVDTIAQGL